jgi:hypothetical protein
MKEAVRQPEGNGALHVMSQKLHLNGLVSRTASAIDPELN